MKVNVDDCCCYSVLFVDAEMVRNVHFGVISSLVAPMRYISIYELVVACFTYCDAVSFLVER